MASSSPRRRRILRRVAFALVLDSFLLLVLVLVLEVSASRAVDLPAVGERFSRNLKLNHSYGPNQRWVVKRWAQANPEYPDPVVRITNHQGWPMTREVSREKAQGTFRIVYLGDSFIEGCVPMDQNLPSLVEAGLRRNADWKVEVVNTGTSSYSPTIHYVLLRHELLDYSPDLVVLSVDMTDDYDDWKYSHTAVLGEDGKVVAVPPRPVHDAAFVDGHGRTVRRSWATDLNLFLYKNSYVYNYLRVVYPPQTDSLPVGPTDPGLYQRWSWCRHDWDASIRENVARTLRLIADIAELCKQRGIKLLLTGVPHRQQILRDTGGRRLWSARPHEAIAEVARTQGVSYFDSLAALEAKARAVPAERLYYRDDMHLNPLGNRLWAEAHLEAILDPAHDLLPRVVYGSGR